MPFRPDPDITNRIIEALSKEEIATINEISRLVQVNRATAEKHLSRLVDENRAREITKPSGRFFSLI